MGKTQIMGANSGLIRLAFAAFAAVVYGLWGAPVPHDPAAAWAAIAGAAGYGVLLHLLDPSQDWGSERGAWAVSATDAGLITLFLAATGGWASPWFPLFYPSMLALSLHLGTEETMMAATGYVALYALVAALDGSLVANLGIFVVRVSFIYAVGALGILLSDAFLQETLDRRRFEALARRNAYQANLLESSFEATEDGILVVDLEGNIVQWNARFQEMWGIPDEVVEGRKDQEAIDYVLDQLEDPDGFLETVEALYGSPYEKSFDVLRFEDGRVFERSSRPQVLDGQAVGRVWTFRDVTDRERRERALEEYADRLEESNEDLEQFANAVSHDLRTPLAGVLSNLDLLEDGVRQELDEEASETFDQAVASAERMEEMIGKLLRYARLRHDGTGEEPETVDTAAVLEEAKANLAHRIREEGATVAAVGPLAPVEAHEAHVLTIFQNLVGNALQYRGKDPPEVRVEARRGDDGMVRVSVSDNGQGIPEGEREQVLELFSQGSNGNLEGTGTGLATCRRLVRRYEGSIGIDSTVGEGTTVHFTLPAGDGGPEG